ncbi:MAG TPA: outer membrane lipoprotein-sorting protein [Candidatus Acidoferrales bacterium]|nr:outer membrane lipoprotein-sorting protein [Candidatus Acidoferrales bacterium]
MVAKADTTNDSADAEVQGQALAERILAARPAADSTNLGVLQIRNAEGERTELPIEARTILTPAGWVGIYEVTTNTDRPNDFIRILHRNGPNLYWTSWDPNAANAEYSQSRVPPLSEPFAGSDFSMGDLGLEFFHWPQQKILKKEFHRQCACMVLESTNPHPTPNGYSRVVSWIDEESLGIVEAYAYDATGRKLKNFYPKSLEKVNGRYQVESMVMENLQTGSKSVFEFDLHK